MSQNLKLMEVKTMIKSNAEILDEVEEDLQLQSGLVLSKEERQCILETGMLFLPGDRIQPFLAGIRSFLQETDPGDRVWTIYNTRDVGTHEFGSYILFTLIKQPNNN